ncbi:hypothetical protein ACFV4G_20185 [Kitasatospora sp. NPDC059747]
MRVERVALTCSAAAKGLASAVDRSSNRPPNWLSNWPSWVNC